MMLPDTTRIAKEKTVADWKAMKHRLEIGGAPERWEEAFNDFFYARVDSRYFESVRAIEKAGQKIGEGFAIVVLHCSLIEFLASTLEGKRYRYVGKDGSPLSKYEYSNSKDMFVRFLEKNEPFKQMFAKNGTATEFYKSVRCGLMHEARTKGQWRILVSGQANQPIDTDTKVIYRDLMQSAFDQFIDCYKQRLLKESSLQRAFIRKIDGLCEE